MRIMNRKPYIPPQIQEDPVVARGSVMLLGSSTAPQPGKQSQKKMSPVF